ncbi:MAG TPA: base excision DNA repair protein [Silvibacterium sp.]|nr:base excision DNA repair protein [Silvibacterium sp.]
MAQTLDTTPPPILRSRAEELHVPAPAARLRTFYAHLVEAYGPQQWWPAETPFEVVIGAYLTQNTAWTSVEKSIANLGTRELLSVAAIRALPEEELRELIRPSGYMNRKATAIKAFVNFLDSDYGGSLERFAEEDPETARERLLNLPGVGPETADAILLYALGHPAVVVDEYLRRVVTRHRLVGEKAKYLEIQALGEAAFEGEPHAERAGHCNEFHALIVEVGKRHCRRVPVCEGCPLHWDLVRPHSGTE